MTWQKVAGRILTFGVAALFVIFAITGVTPTWWPAVLTTGSAIVSLLLGTVWKAPEPTDAGAPKWQQLVGRSATTIVAGILLVFGATGVTPDWWPGVLAMAQGLLNQLIGTWNPPQVA
jgi:membrane glycosyltransferase